jgi:hypothetical protein
VRRGILEEEAETVPGLRLQKSVKEMKPASSDRCTPEVWTVFQDAAAVRADSLHVQGKSGVRQLRSVAEEARA